MTDRLAAEPARFDFFQAVRLLERHGTAAGRSPLGGDDPPGRETVRLRVLPALSFPVGAVARVEFPPAGDGKPPAVVAAFTGLFGPNGVLPQHYTALILARLRQRDATLRAFVDLFHHRLLAQLYRAWEKTHFPVAAERARQDRRAGPDAGTTAVLAAAGFGTGGLAPRAGVPADTVAYYAGLFARRPRTASGLEQLVGEYFGWPARVKQLFGQWFYLDGETRARLPDAADPPDAGPVLGATAVIGRRVWDAQSKVRVVVGPLRYADFRRLMPGGDARGPLGKLCRVYLGLDLDVDVQVVLLPDEVPWARLTHAEADRPRLGRTAWVRTHNFGDPVGDATFAVD